METQIIEFIQEHDIATVATNGPDGPHAVPVYYYYDSERNVFFFATKQHTLKASTIGEHPRVYLSIFSADPAVVFGARCTGQVISDFDDYHMDIIHRLIDIHGSEEHFPTPLVKLTESGLVLVELAVSDVNFARYES